MPVNFLAGLGIGLCLGGAGLVLFLMARGPKDRP